MIKITVNGKLYEMDISESRTLAEFLRYDLGLTGTKIGCEEAECGICTVLVDGVPMNSCIYPVYKANGAEIQTIEGLASKEKLHPLQDAFLEHGAVQCGFCTPGVIMTSKALLDEKPNPTEGDIKIALKDTYCRCTGYSSIVNAVQSAASDLRGEGHLPWNKPDTVTPLDVVGTSVPRPEEKAKVTGEAKYADDYQFEGMLYGATKRSDHPHARILSIDTSKAVAYPGVTTVLTHDDIPGDNIHGLIFDDWPCLAVEKVRYMGDPIAIVAAETQEAANYAATLVEVDYEVLPVISNPILAYEKDAALVHEDREDGNLLKHIKVYKGDVNLGRQEADVIIERTYQTPTTEHAFMEPECSIAVPAKYDEEHEKLTIYCGTQIPYSDRIQVERIMGLAEKEVRVRGTIIGGGFGGKEDLVSQAHAALLASATNKPVKILFSRHESLLYHPKRHATVIKIATGAKQDGSLVFVEAELYGDTGAYASLGDKVMGRATTHATGPYNVPHAKIDCYAMYTNNPPAGAFRGFGVTQSAYAVESNMDLVAEALDMDPLEFRRKNAQKAGSTTLTGQVMRESVGLVETIDKVQETVSATANGSGFKWGWREGNKAYGWGVACAYKNSGLGGGAPDKSEVEIEAYEDSSIEVRTSAADLGQGIGMMIAQISAEELGLPYERVKVLLSDTDLTPDSGKTTASRQTFMTGNAARLAAIALREALSTVAGEYFNAPPGRLKFSDGDIQVNGQSASLGEVVVWMKAQGQQAKASYQYDAPETMPLGEEGDMHFAFSYATQAALVEVNMDTGEVKVKKVISGADVGRAVNPRSVQGQIEGGIMMGLGNCLTEEYITEDGVPWSVLFARYKIPSIKHLPEIISHIIEDPVSTGPYGAKGVGELAPIGTAPAICNAIYNATGVRVYSTPVDQDALLRAIKSGKSAVLTTWHDVR
jgi:selenium-dependent xanthine dehydrogenase